MSFLTAKLDVTAIQFTNETKNQVFNFVDCTRYASFDDKGAPTLTIRTPSGEVTAKIGDWIIRLGTGNFYVCDNDSFSLIAEFFQENEHCNLYKQGKPEGDCCSDGHYECDQCSERVKDFSGVPYRRELEEAGREVLHGKEVK